MEKVLKMDYLDQLDIYDTTDESEQLKWLCDEIDELNKHRDILGDALDDLFED